MRRSEVRLLLSAPLTKHRIPVMNDLRGFFCPPIHSEAPFLIRYLIRLEVERARVNIRDYTSEQTTPNTHTSTFAQPNTQTKCNKCRSDDAVNPDADFLVARHSPHCASR